MKKEIRSETDFASSDLDCFTKTISHTDTSGGWYCKRCGNQMYLPQVFCIYCMKELKEDIGNKLFNSLNLSDKFFILETEGIIDLGYEVDLNDIQRIIDDIKG